jgi:hypothetical protein
MTLSKCPRCKHQSLKEINESQVIGITHCAMGKRAVMNRKQFGVKCLLCNYSNLKVNIIDSRGHKVV